MTKAESPNSVSAATVSPEREGKRLSYVAPIVITALIGLALAVGLNLNPREIPSALIGSPIPTFELPPIPGRGLGLSSGDLKGKVSVVNVWASWCVECRKEHPLLMTLQERAKVPLHGISYKDKSADAVRWLASLGDPYNRIGADLDGRVSIDWGVYGIPETFVIDKRGRIAHKVIGAVNEQLLTETIFPLIEELRAAVD